VTEKDLHKDNERLFSDYYRGYFKALVDLKNLFENIGRNMPFRWTLKSYRNMVLSVLLLLASDSYIRSLFQDYGGIFNFCNDRVAVKMRPDGTVFAEYRN